MPPSLDGLGVRPSRAGLEVRPGVPFDKLTGWGFGSEGGDGRGVRTAGISLDLPGISPIEAAVLQLPGEQTRGGEGVIEVAARRKLHVCPPVPLAFGGW